MARFNFDPVPEIAPEGPRGDDYQHINVSPEMFGGAIARATENVGGALEHVSQVGFDVRNYWDAVQTDNAVNGFQQDADRIRYGDPNSPPGPDGQPSAKGYLATRQGDAVAAHAAASDDIEKARQRYRATLPTSAQIKFDQQTRRMQSMFTNEIGQHAISQGYAQATVVNQTGAELAKGDLIRHADDDAYADDATERYVQAKVKEEQVKYGERVSSGEGGDQKWNVIRDYTIEKARAEALEARADAIAARNPNGAIELADKHKTELGAAYAPLIEKLHTRASQQVGDERFAVAMQSAAKYAITGPEQRNVLGSVFEAQEGEKDRFGNWKTSYTGARGPRQIEPGTWNQWAKPGENIDNPDDNRAVSDRMLQAYWDKYHDIQRVAVAYYSGEANVAPPGSPTPWIRNISDPRGTQSTSGYVSQIMGRMNSVATYKPIAMDLLTKDPVLQSDPVAMQHASTRLAHFFNMEQIAENQTARAQKDAFNSAVNGYVTRFYNELHSPKPNLQGLMGEINADPIFDHDPMVKVHLMDKLKSADPAEQGLEFGPGYFEAKRRMFLPADHPDHMTIRDVVMRDDIKPAGTKDLIERVQFAKKDLPRDSYEKRMNFALASANQIMSNEQDVGPIKLRNPKGEQLFKGVFAQQFVQGADEIYNKVRDGSADPKKLDEYFSDANVRKMIDEVYPRNKRNMDEISARGETEAKTPKQTYDPEKYPAPAGIDPATYKTVMENQLPVMKNGQSWPMENWHRLVTALQSDPSANNKKATDEFLGAGTADKILGSLHGTTATPSTAIPGATVVPPHETIAETSRVSGAEAAKLSKEARERQEAAAQTGARRREQMPQ